MKKLKRFVLILAIFAMLPLSVNAKEKVNVYLFKREGCGFCANALTFFTNLSEDEEYQNYFNLVTKETLNNKVNSDLMEAVAKRMNVDLNGVPFIVIGEEYFEGYSNTFDEKLKNAIKNAYENESIDIVASLENKDDSNSGAITVVILLTVVAGIAFLVYMAKDSANVEDEDVVEGPKEEVKPVKTVKKTTAKKTTTKTTSSKKKSNKK